MKKITPANLLLIAIEVPRLLLELGTHAASMFFISPLTAKLINFNFHPLEVVSR